MSRFLRWWRIARRRSSLARRARSTALSLALEIRGIKQRPFQGYYLAVLLIAIASLLQWRFQEQYAGAPFLTIYPAIIIATLVGGTGPGIVSAILAGASQFGLFIPRFYWVAFNSYAIDAAACVGLIVLMNHTIEELWTIDTLTGLANRTRFNEQLKRVLKQSRPGERTAVLYINLDHIKLVNGALGPALGDKLIQDAANRLCACIRDVDFIARLNGDEFAIIQPRIAGISDAEELAIRAHHALHQPFWLDGNDIRLSASIGIAICPDDSEDLDDLLRAAGIALSEAKSAEGDGYRFFREEMNKSAGRRHAIERELGQALAKNQLQLLYQPIVNLGDGRIKTFEALLRWDHPELGPISPTEFIPIAEENGLIAPIGEWVLRTACSEATKWGGDIDVGVNVSVVQLATGSLVDIVEDALNSAGLPPHRLVIEITESVLLESTSANIETLKKINNLGVNLSMDDFGAGHTSLTHLLSVPFKKIKIDKRFIDGLPHKRESRAVVRAIANMARELGIRAVAEGVEEVAQLEEARCLGCTDIQGYLVSVPLPAGQIPDLCRAYGIEGPEPAWRKSAAR